MKIITKLAVLIMMLLILTVGAYSANDSLLINLKNGQQKVISLTKIKMALFEQVNLVINPKISISKSLLPVGESQVISASGYPANKEVRLHIFRANAIIDTFDIVTDIDGKFTKNYTTDNDFYAGRYLVSSWVKDNANISSNQLQFEVIKDDKNESDTIKLIIQDKNYAVGEGMLIEWYDFSKIKIASDTNRLSEDKAWLLSNFVIEYSLDEGQNWDTIYTLNAFGKLNQLNRFFHWIILTDDYVGDLQIRIKDMNYIPQNKAKKKEDELQSYSGRFSNIVNPKVSKKVKVTFEWCVPMQINQQHKRLNPIGVGADGVSPIIVRVYIPDSDKNNITSISCQLSHTFADKSFNGLGYVLERSYYNNLSYSELNVDNNNKKVSFESSGENGKMFYDFWYVAPSDFVIDNSLKESVSRDVDLKVLVNYKNGKSPFQEVYKIEIYRPPLLLIHGLNSDSEMWIKFRESTFYLYQFPRIFSPTIGKGKLNLNLLANELFEKGFHSFYHQLTNYGISAIQVDYVSHSMGSLMLRKALTKNDYTSINYNLGKGFVHKMVSINSPHNGSYNANLLNEFCNAYNKNPNDNYKFINLNNQLRRKVLNNMGIIINDDKTLNVNDAIGDLYVNDGGNNNFSISKIKNHLIASDIFMGNNSESYINSLGSLWALDDNALDFGISTLLDIMKVIKFNNNNFIDGRSFYKDMLNMNIALQSIGVNENWLWKSDLIVGTNSQLAGKIFDLNSTDLTIKCFPKIGHAMMNPVYNQKDVIDHVTLVLNSRMGDGYFSDEIAATNFNKSVFKPEKDGNEESQVILLDTNKIQISVNKNNVNVGDDIELSIYISDTTGFQLGRIQFQNSNYQIDTLSNSYRFYLPAGNYPLDTNYIFVICRFALVDTLINSIKSIPIIVAPQDSLMMLKSDSKFNDVFVGDEKELKYIAYFKTFITEVNPTFSNFKLQITDTNVVEYSLKTNTLKAKKFGSTLLIANYQDKYDTTYYYIDTLIVHPNIDLLDFSNKKYYLKDTLNVSYDLIGNFSDSNMVYFTVFEFTKPDSLVFMDSIKTNESGKFNIIFNDKFQIYQKYLISASTSHPQTFSFMDTVIILNNLQNINLSTGWNLISSHIQPQVPDSLNNVLDDVAVNMLIAKDIAGAVYIPAFDINTIGKWNVTQGYQLYMTQADTLTVIGVEVIPSDTPIQLSAGWNMISYLRNSEISAELAFASITDNENLLIAKTLDGRVYIPAYSINTIGNMKPGVGYRVYVTTSDTLVYPDNE